VGRARAAADARVRRARHRRPTRPPARVRLREGRPRDAVLDARHHRAPQRGRRRAVAHQPRARHRPRRKVGLGPQPAPRAERRAGRRRHGRLAAQAARLRGRRRRGGACEVGSRVGPVDSSEGRPPRDGLVRGG
jgi:hypothetical protein